MVKLSRLAISGMLAIVLFLLNEPTHAEDFSVEGNVISLPEQFLNGSEKQNTSSVIPLTNESITLEGLVDQAELYYEIPVQAIKKESKLNVKVQYSELLLKGSTVTIYIDDEPVFTTALDLKKRAMDIEIPLTGDAVEQGFHKVTVSFYGHLSEQMCADLDNPANWLTILPESYLFLNFQEALDRENTLYDYPYPFIQKNQENEIQSKIVVPDNPSAANLSAALQLADSLLEQTNGKAAQLIVKESELNVVSDHLIIVGAEGQWTGLIKHIYETANLSLPSKEIVLSTYYVKSNKAMKQVLFVTATDDQIIADKVRMLTEKQLSDQLAGNELSIAQVPSIPKQKLNSKQTFKDIGITDQTLTGKQSISQSYFYEIPPYIQSNEQAMLHLNLKVSKTLFNDEQYTAETVEDAELVLFINELPYSIAINDLDKQNESFYEVEVPIESHLLQQERFLTIQFQANGLREDAFCTPANEDKWIFIHEDSYLQLGIQHHQSEASFKAWPSPFSSVGGLDETVIVLPRELDQQLINQLSLLTQSLGRGGKINELEILFDNNLNEDSLTSKNVIIFGGVIDHPYLKDFYDDLLIKVDDNYSLDASAFHFVNETSKNIAWVQPSIWNKKNVMVVFSPMHDKQTVPFLTENLLEYVQANVLDANIVVESQNGEVFSHVIKDVDVVDSDSSNGIIQSDQTKIERWIVIGFIIIVVVSTGIFACFFRNRKAKTKRNS
ncbi:cellulose biosynthesis cyclic di-GMP-binding regulatory protein BcsB [Virgibacillus sp. W0430]|uniref:cellulose biosynthesis cyclic di-GMP-binding regulatory protein BcsB n=1 Tax=Virgibacillus sp. W0430 TaxID=3391580 RepID=UPI003F47D8C4